MKIDVGEYNGITNVLIDFEGENVSFEEYSPRIAGAAIQKIIELHEEIQKLKAWRDAKTDPPKESGTYLAGWFCGGKGAVAANYWTGSSWLGCDNEPVDVWRHMPELHTGGCG